MSVASEPAPASPALHRERWPAIAAWGLAGSAGARASLLGLLALAIYAPLLDHAPVYLVHDEVVFALNAHAVATTGRGVAGEWMPLYFHIGGRFWSTPWVVYFPALFLTVLPVSITTIRLPTAVLGALVVALIYLVARRLIGREAPAVSAAVLLAVTPAHVIHSRLGVDHLYPLPFVLGWLLCLIAFRERGRLWHLFAAGVMLGLGFYTYLASMVMMPLYLGLTGLFVCMTHERRVRALGVAVAGFAIPLLPLVPWFLTHPEQFGQQLAMYNLGGAETVASPLRAVARNVSYLSVNEHVRVWAEFFNPSFLFFSGDPSIINSTRAAGVFLFALAVLIPIGVNEVVNYRRNALTLLVLTSFLLAPVAGVLVGEVKVNRALALVPLGVLLGAFGLDRLLAVPGRWGRAVAAALLVAALLQFGHFFTDYLTDYRVRSSIWFESNRRGAFDVVLALDREGTLDRVSLDAGVPWLREHWQLYLVEHGRTDLLARTDAFEAEQLTNDTGPPGRVLVGALDRLPPEADAWLRGAYRWTEVPEPDGRPFFFVAGPVTADAPE